MDKKRFLSVSLVLIFIGMGVYAWTAYAQTKPIATSDGESPGTRVEVQELKRSSGGTVTLKFTVINDSNAEISSNYLFIGPGEANTVGGVTLVDPVSKKKYLVIRDTEGHCMCSVDIANFKAKTSTNLWAKFPAPPADVKKVSVIIPHVIPMDDVPISE